MCVSFNCPVRFSDPHQGWRAVTGVRWGISLGVEVLFLQFSTLSGLTWGFVSLAHAISELISSSDLTLELEE